jgi:hypothetical protein
VSPAIWDEILGKSSVGVLRLRARVVPVVPRNSRHSIRAVFQFRLLTSFDKPSWRCQRKRRTQNWICRLCGFQTLIQVGFRTRVSDFVDLRRFRTMNGLKKSCSKNAMFHGRMENKWGRALAYLLITFLAAISTSSDFMVFLPACMA